jgi:hypothetical protein
MCRFAAATALEKPRWCLPMESEGPSDHRFRITAISDTERGTRSPQTLGLGRPNGTTFWLLPRPSQPRMGFPWNQGSFSAGLQETVESEEFHDLEAPCLTRHTGLA